MNKIDWEGKEVELGTRLTLFLGEPHNVMHEFERHSKRLYDPELEVPFYDEDTEPAGEIFDRIASGRGWTRSGYTDFDYIAEHTIPYDYYKLFTDVYNLTLPQPWAVLNLPETKLSERTQSGLIREAIKSGKRLFIYTQSEVIMLECMLGIKEGLLNLEEVKLYMVEGKEVIDVELIKGGRFKSFGDSFPGSVRSNQMKRYVGF